MTKKFKVNIVLKNGHTFERKVVCIPEKLTSVFGKVDECWNGTSKGGFLSLGNLYISMNEIASYEIKRSWF